jgi:uncharacterized protein YlbG (UPF0298 family)
MLISLSLFSQERLLNINSKDIIAKMKEEYPNYEFLNKSVTKEGDVYYFFKFKSEVQLRTIGILINENSQKSDYLVYQGDIDELDDLIEKLNKIHVKQYGLNWVSVNGEFTFKITTKRRDDGSSRIKLEIYLTP